MVFGLWWRLFNLMNHYPVDLSRGLTEQSQDEQYFDPEELGLVLEYFRILFQ